MIFWGYTMKDHTDEFLKDITDQTIPKDLAPEVREMMTKVLNLVLDNFKFYELSNVKDIVDNYGKVSEPTSNLVSKFYGVIGGDNVFKLFRKFNKVEDKELESLMESYLLLVDPVQSDKSFDCNLNFCEISNVYLRNMNFVKTPKYELCEFDIADIHGTDVRGVFVYKAMDIIGGLLADHYKELLGKLVASTDIAPFDLMFTGMYENYESGGRNIQRGKRLRVMDMQKHKDGDKDKEVINPFDNFVDSPVFEPVFSGV